MNDPAERGHNYFFGQIPEMPWKRSSDIEESEGGSDQPKEDDEGLDELEPYNGKGIA